MPIDLLEIRRRILLDKKVVNIPFTTNGESNSKTSWDKRTYTGGKFTITVPSAQYTQQVTAYQNGYVTIFAPEFEVGNYYIFTSDALVTENHLNSQEIAIAPFGNNNLRTDGVIADGKIRLKFQFKSGSGDKRFEFRCGGKSLVLSNIKFWVI